ncbi:Imm70 family immunity protein [Methylophaga sp.]|uniref:Imm70 family immunity protein n=1 Tax=Methylophaga sp. TaxID=2024840 RepID=UPI0027252240|nr:Imm70 family immunity protein [Methylophaga sp.]MDO8826363.1 Imm70 family immunity protein [Methylophaga sp.]
MAVGIKVGSITDEIGTPDFFHAFFSTVNSNLEKEWGSRFPVLLNNLYQGGLEAALAAKALAELKQVKDELAAFSPEHVVWDIEDPSKQPPWSSDISPDITSLANYFVTSTGRDLIETLLEALDEAARYNRPAAIVQC